MAREDEKSWDMISAAFAETDKIMSERGWDAAAVTQEYVRRAVDRLWTNDEDREALRANVQAAVSSEVDALFNAIGDTPQAA